MIVIISLLHCPDKMADGQQEFNISDWAQEFELSDQTLVALREKGFSSKWAFSKLTPEMIKKEFIKSITLAQHMLLIDVRVASWSVSQLPLKQIVEAGVSSISVGILKEQLYSAFKFYWDFLVTLFNWILPCFNQWPNV